MKHHHTTPRILLCVSLATCASAVLADDNILDTIVVTATRSDQQSVITPTAITTITHEQIEQSGASNVVDILRTQPGIQLQDTIGDSAHAVIGMRGFSATAQNNVLVMIDGRILNNPTLEAPALSSISINDIERIEIIQGSAGVLYGDQAVGGVINIITKTPEKKQLHVEAGRGTDDLEVYRGTVSQKLENGFAYRLSAENKNADNYRDNNESAYKDYFGRVEYNTSKAGIFIEQQIINDNLHLPGSLTIAQAAQDRRQTFTPLDFTNQDINSSRLGGNAWLTDNLQFLAEITNRDMDGNGYSYGSNLSSTDAQSFNPRLAGTFSTANGDAKFTVGSDLDKSTYQTSYGGYPSSDFEQKQHAIYGQLTYPVIKDVFVSCGYREATAEDNDKALLTKHDDTANAKELGVSYYGIKQFRLFARIADTFRFANADENALTLPGISFLKPQTSKSNEVGFEYTAQKFNVLTQIYDMNLDNEIIYDEVIANPNSPFGGKGANLNLDSSNRKGFLVQSSYNATDSIRVTANYTYTDAGFTSGSFKGNVVPFVAKHTASFGATYQINTAWSIYADETYIGSQYRIGDEANIDDKVSAYWLTNANVQWKKENLAIKLRINNLTGKEYSSAVYSSGAQYPAAERTMELTVGYDF